MLLVLLLVATAWLACTPADRRDVASPADESPDSTGGEATRATSPPDAPVTGAQASGTASSEEPFPPAPAGRALAPNSGDYTLHQTTVVRSECGATRFHYPELSEQQRRFEVRSGAFRDDATSEEVVSLQIFGPGGASTMDARLETVSGGEATFRYRVTNEEAAGGSGGACLLGTLAEVTGRVLDENRVLLDVVLTALPPDSSRFSDEDGETYDASACQERLSENLGVEAWNLERCRTWYRLDLRLPPET